MVIQKIPAEETVSLRHKILRPNQSKDKCVYPGDGSGGDLHFGAFEGNFLVGIVSLYDEPHASEDSRILCRWRLRGMATDTTVRGQGLGGLLLHHSLDWVNSNDAQGVWCNARTSACGFYEKFGFQKMGKEFHIDPIGPHFVMYKL